MSKIKVIGGIVNKRDATLYTESGDTIVIVQGDPRMKYVVEKVIPELRDTGTALYDPAIAGNNFFAELEQKTGGTVKFFSIARKKLKKLLGIGEEEEPTTTPIEEDVLYGDKPVEDDPIQEEGTGSSGDVGEPVKKVVEQPKQSAEEILTEHGAPSTSDKFDPTKFNKAIDLTNGDNHRRHDKHDDEEETVVAVVDGKIIPNAERLHTQVKRSVKTGNTVGMENMLKRLATVVDKRSHSVEDFIRFVERADLPISDQGMLIAYKILRKKETVLSDLLFEYVDCHTRNVSQGVGTIVHMDEKMVDPNRRNECSNGLHIARRAYVGQFSGDVCTLCYVDPIDVIAVPNYDANKIRVCKYTILAELTDSQYQALRSNNSIDNCSGGKELIAMAMQHLFPEPTKAVKIGGGHGTNLSAEMLKAGKKADVVGTVDTSNAEALDNDANDKIDHIDPRRIETEAPTPVIETEDATDENYALPADVEPEPEPEVTEPEEVETKADKAEELAPVIEPAPKASVEPKAKKPAKKKAAPRKKGKRSNSPRAQIATLLKGQTVTGMSDATKDAVIALKQQSKKGWGALEVDPVFATELIAREKVLKSRK